MELECPLRSKGYGKGKRVGLRDSAVGQEFESMFRKRECAYVLRHRRVRDAFKVASCRET